jgi:hypothetical protein
MTPMQEYKMLYERMHEISTEQGWGDPFSYARSREILIAGTLGHKISSTLSGADGIDQDGECEYKSTVNGNIQGGYTGISVHETWEKQVDYLRNHKIAKYKNHYISRFSGGMIAEIWKLDGTVVCDIHEPKLEKNYPTVLTKKDPRLRALLTKKEIHANGEKIFG